MNSEKLIPVLVIILLFIIFPVGALSYTSQYPIPDAAHVKATTYFTEGYPTYINYPENSTDPSRSLTGTWDTNQWLSGQAQYTNQRINIDLGEAKIIRRLYYENSHLEGGYTSTGAKIFKFLGTNNSDSFNEISYEIDTGWTALSSWLVFDEHTASDIPDPKFSIIDNPGAYKYYSVKIADTWGSTSNMGLRRIELQTEEGYPPEPTPTPTPTPTGAPTNATMPVVLSFQGGHAYGENPVEIIDNQTGRGLIIDTSSKNITISSEGTFKIRVEPAGLSDAANNPDAALSGILGYVTKNPIGIVAAILAIAVVIFAFLNRRK